ncbi:MAG: hypothetical protein GF329_07250 [Candidatus Lokiarchaeota archaeon]|nr:hypothetical protein [Candidatus Lokiarchaeota archaeon]
MIKNKYDFIFYNAGLIGLIIARKCAESGFSSLVLEKNKEFGLSTRCGNYLDLSSLKELNVNDKSKIVQAKVEKIIIFDENNQEIKNLPKKFFVVNSRLLERSLALKAASSRIDMNTLTKIIEIKENKHKIERIRIKSLKQRKDIRSKLIISKSPIGAENLALSQSNINKIKTSQYEIFSPTYNPSNKILICELDRFSGRVIIFPSTRKKFNAWMIGLENKITLKDILKKYLKIESFSVLNIYHQVFFYNQTKKGRYYKNLFLLRRNKDIINPFEHHNLINEVRIGLYLAKYLKNIEIFDDNSITEINKYYNDYKPVLL